MTTVFKLQWNLELMDFYIFTTNFLICYAFTQLTHLEPAVIRWFSWPLSHRCCRWGILRLPSVINWACDDWVEGIRGHPSTLRCWLFWYCWTRCSSVKDGKRLDELLWKHLDESWWVFCQDDESLEVTGPYEASWLFNVVCWHVDNPCIPKGGGGSTSWEETTFPYSKRMNI